MGDSMDNTAKGMSASSISIQICHVTPDEQLVRELSVPEGTTVVQAMRQAGLAERFAEAISHGYIGIYGRKVPVDTVLSANDRIEIYRPLKDLPQNIRRRRVEQMRSGGYTKWDKKTKR